MTRRLTQSLALLLLAAAVPACGKYGPPARLPVAAASAAGEPSATPPVETAPPSGAAAPDGESCEDEPGSTSSGTP